jgi:Predicted transcriptional regulators
MARLEDLQIEMIRVNPANIRSEIDTSTDKMQRLANEIKTVGLVEPLRVYPHPDIEGDYLLQDGHRRRLAAIAAGLSSVPCLVIDAPKRGTLEDIDVMMTTGRNHEQLNVLEEARGFQAMLDLGLSEATIAKKYKKPKSEISVKAKLDAAPDDVKYAYGVGRMDLEDAKRLQDLEEAGAADVYERVVERVGKIARQPYGQLSVERVILEEESALQKKRLREDVEALGGREAPSDVSYNGKYEVAPKLSDHEHAEVGDVFQVSAPYDHSTGQSTPSVVWYRKAKKATPEMSEEEKAEKQRFRALAGALGISFRVRRTFLAEQVSNPMGGVNQATDQEMLFELLWPDISRLDDEMLGDITGIHKPEGADSGTSYGGGDGYRLRQEWLKKVQARFATFTWRQIVRAYALYKNQDTDKQLRNVKNFDRSAYEWRTRKTWLDRLQHWFGYHLDQTEQDILEHFKAKGGSSGSDYNMTETEKTEYKEHGRVLGEDVEVLP